jgi:hypothetical protein
MVLRCLHSRDTLTLSFYGQLWKKLERQYTILVHWVCVRKFSLLMHIGHQHSLPLDHEFKASPGCILRPCLKKNKQRNKQTKGSLALYLDSKFDTVAH